MVIGPEGGLGSSGSVFSLRGSSSYSTTGQDGGKAGVQTCFAWFHSLLSQPLSNLVELNFSDS